MSDAIMDSANPTSGNAPANEPPAPGGVWKDIVGQRPVIDRLSRIVASADGKDIAQSWLICGPPGSGRSNVARAFAAALECPDHGCGECRVCRQVLAGTHPDLTVLATDKVIISIDEVRALVETSEQMPSVSPWRIIIIRDVDRMIERTTNVLLKEIEEPAEHTIWLLCAPGANDVLPTIRSRTRLITLAVPTNQAVAQHLVDTVAFLRQRATGAKPRGAGRGAGKGAKAGRERGDVSMRIVRPDSPEGVDAEPLDPKLAARCARFAQGHIGVARLYAIDSEMRAARERLVDGVLSMAVTSDAVLLADRLVTDANAQAEEEAERNVAAAQREFRRINGLGEDERVPPNLRGAYNAIGKKDAVKRLTTRGLRNVLDRYLNDIASIYRDVAVQQNGAQRAVGLVNLEQRERIAALSGRLTRQGTLDRLDRIELTRRRLNGNVTPLLAFEALLASLVV